MDGQGLTLVLGPGASPTLSVHRAQGYGLRRPRHRLVDTRTNPSLQTGRPPVLLLIQWRLCILRNKAAHQSLVDRMLWSRSRPILSVWFTEGMG